MLIMSRLYDNGLNKKALLLPPTAADTVCPDRPQPVHARLMLLSVTMMTTVVVEAEVETVTAHQTEVDLEVVVRVSTVVLAANTKVVNDVDEITR